MAEAVEPAMGSESDPFVESLPATTVSIAGAAPVLTLAVALLELSFRVNREEGSIITPRVRWAVLVAASTKAGPVYPGMSIEHRQDSKFALHIFPHRALHGAVNME